MHPSTKTESIKKYFVDVISNEGKHLFERFFFSSLTLKKILGHIFEKNEGKTTGTSKKYGRNLEKYSWKNWRKFKYSKILARLIYFEVQSQLNK